MNLEELEIKGAVIMTPKQMAADQSAMKDKFLVVGWHYPYAVYIFDSISVNTDKLVQMRKHAEYAGYMDDYHLKAKDGTGHVGGLDGHNGTKYDVFEKLEDARRAVKLLSELHDTEEFENTLEYYLEELTNARIGKNLSQDILNLYESNKSQIQFTITKVKKKRKELISLLKKGDR